MDRQVRGADSPRLRAATYRVRSVPSLKGRDWIGYAALVVAWLMVNANFWVWWLQPGKHRLGVDVLVVHGRGRLLGHVSHQSVSVLRRAHAPACSVAARARSAKSL